MKGKSAEADAIQSREEEVICPGLGWQQAVTTWDPGDGGQSFSSRTENIKETKKFPGNLIVN